MNARAQPRLLVVDANPAQAQAMGQPFEQAGFQVGLSTFEGAVLLRQLSGFSPNLVLAHAEPGSPGLQALWAALDEKQLSEVPIALLCREVKDEVFVRPLRTGVVELLPEPFSARLHLSRLRTLSAELPERAGRVRGRGAPGELTGLIQAVMRLGQSGTLSVGPEMAEEGSAVFVRGRPRTARYHQSRGPQALSGLARLAGQVWCFTETEADGFLTVSSDSDEFAAPPPPPPDLPATAGGDPWSNAAQTVAPSAPQPDADAGSTPLLFVDDESAVLTLVTDYFKKRGYPVVSAGDGVQALEVLSRQPVALVVADLNMPRLDGWGLLRAIREDLRLSETPVAFFSAADDYRDSLKLLQAGAQAYFPKTIRVSALEAQLQDVLEPRRRFRRNIGAEGGLSWDLAELGPQWVLAQLSAARFSGRVDGKDPWATYRLWFDDGRLAQVNAKLQQGLLTADRALLSVLVAKACQVTLTAGTLPAPDEGFGGHGTSATLQRLVPWLAEEQRKSREEQLAKTKALIVDDETYQLYVTFGPPVWLPIARLLCEQRLAPAQVMTQLNVTPMEVAQVVRDLIRRGVVSLKQ